MTKQLRSEKAIIKDITRHLDRLGIWWVKLHGSIYQQRGLPDLLVVAEGMVFFFEVKRAGGKPTTLQQHTLERIRGAGAPAEVVTSWDDVSKIMAIGNKGKGNEG